MNAHDSEKVIGTLLAKGYSQVDTPEAADLVLYNTCSIRDKAEQKVFNRLQNFKREAGKGKVFAKNPMRSCVSGEPRPAIGTPTTKSSWCEYRPSTTAKAANTVMNSVAPSALLKSPSRFFKGAGKQ